MKLQKIIMGYVVQTFDTDEQEFIDQRFIALDDIIWENEIGECVDPPLPCPPYLAFDMHQPTPEERNMELILCKGMETRFRGEGDQWK